MITFTAGVCDSPLSAQLLRSVRLTRPMQPQESETGTARSHK